MNQHTLDPNDTVEKEVQQNNIEVWKITAKTGSTIFNSGSGF